MEKNMEENMKGIISVTMDIHGDCIIRSDNVEVLDKMATYLYETYDGFVKKTTFNRDKSFMHCWDKRNYILKIFGWCMYNDIVFYCRRMKCIWQ